MKMEARNIDWHVRNMTKLSGYRTLNLKIWELGREITAENALIFVGSLIDIMNIFYTFEKPIAMVQITEVDLDRLYDDLLPGYRKITIFEYEVKSKPVREIDDFEMVPVELDEPIVSDDED